MRNFITGLLQRTLRVAIFTFILIPGSFSQQAWSQEIVHQYKITGPKRVQELNGYSCEKLVEYDPASADHLYISFFDLRKNLLERTQYLFKGKKFNLSSMQDYLIKKELVKDGKQILFSKDQSVDAELLFLQDTLREQTLFYGNGTRQMTFEGDQNILNGKFSMWHLNGKTSFTGNYINNLKDGEFESFDETGNLERKGTYREGKLISGESVVQDLLYDAPEVPAQFMDGKEAFQEYLKAKIAELPAVREMQEGIITDFNLVLTIDKTGHINKLEIASPLKPAEVDIINSVFKEFPGFKPALMEGAPVRSILKQHLVLSNKGLQTNTPLETQTATDKIDWLADSIYIKVDEMPEFPGGHEALLNYIGQTLRYPMEAAQEGIQGKSFISFVIREDGKVINIAIARTAHSLLDAEAVRVVQSMPRWKPGIHKGKAVKVAFTIPIGFKLSR